MTSNQNIQVNNIVDWSVVMSCVCQLILLFSFVLYMVRAVNKFDFRLFINWITNKDNQGKKGKSIQREHEVTNIVHWLCKKRQRKVQFYLFIMWMKEQQSTVMYEW